MTKRISLCSITVVQAPSSVLLFWDIFLSVVKASQKKMPIEIATPVICSAGITKKCVPTTYDVMVRCAAIHQGDNIGSGRAMMVALHRRNATSRFSCLFIFRFAANMGSFFVTMDLGRLRGFTDGGAVGRCFFPDFGANLMRSVIPADTGLVQMCISSFGIGIRIRRLPSSIASHRGESSGKKLNLFCAVFFLLELWSSCGESTTATPSGECASCGWTRRQKCLALALIWTCNRHKESIKSGGRWCTLKANIVCGKRRLFADSLLRHASFLMLILYS